MSIPAARSQNSGSSSASSIAFSYHGDAEKVTAARRSRRASGNLIRGLEAPMHSPQEGSRRQTNPRGRARHGETTSASGRTTRIIPPAPPREAGNPDEPPPPGHTAPATPARRGPAAALTLSRLHSVRKAQETNPETSVTRPARSSF